MLRKYAKAAHEVCGDVPLGLHAHQFRHGKASHWLEDEMNIIQISFLLGHEQLQTTMVYLNITAEEKAKALATLEDENDKKISAKWKNPDGSLVDFCGIRRKRYFEILDFYPYIQIRGDKIFCHKYILH